MIFQDLPVFFADIADDDDAISIISIVDRPAVESNFVKFDAEKKPVRLSTDDERRIVSGVALIPDFPIYRRNADGTEYYLVFTAAAIRRVVERFYARNNSTSVNLNHADAVNSCVIFESMIVDHARGIAPVEFAEYPDGTWIVSTKINDPALWADIKAGKYNGFSVEGVCTIDRKPAERTTMMSALRRLARSVEKRPARS